MYVLTSSVLIKILHQPRSTMRKTLDKYLANSDPLNHSDIMMRKVKNSK